MFHELLPPISLKVKFYARPKFRSVLQEASNNQIENQSQF